MENGPLHRRQFGIKGERPMYQLIVEIDGKTKVLAKSEDPRELELKKEAHIRKGMQGVVSIQEMEKNK